LTEGWAAEPGNTPTAEDVKAHLAQIRETERYTIPMSIFDEIAEIFGRLEASASDDRGGGSV
jgi:hypothetical protein